MFEVFVKYLYGMVEIPHVYIGSAIISGSVLLQKYTSLIFALQLIIFKRRGEFLMEWVVVESVFTQTAFAQLYCIGYAQW